MAWLQLFGAISLEVLGTSLLKYTEGFTRLAYSAFVIVCYFSSFYLLSLVIRTIPVGIAYAVWASIGIVIVAAVGYVVHGQRLDFPAILGITLMLLGVIIIHLFSKSVEH